MGLGLGILASAVPAVLAFKYIGPVARRVGAFFCLISAMLSFAVAPAWFFDRVEVGPERITIRTLKGFKLARWDLRWDQLEWVRFGHSCNNKLCLGLYEKGKGSNPSFIELEEPTLRAVMPDVSRWARTNKVEYQED